VGPKCVFVQGGEVLKKGLLLYTSPPNGKKAVGGVENIFVVWDTAGGCRGVAQ